MHKQLRRKCILLLLGGIFSRSLLSPFGTHSLHYNLTVRSQGGSVQSRFFAEGYWDHQLFLQYDSDKKESAKPQELWAEKPLGTESWDTEIQELAEHSKDLKATLANINALQDSDLGNGSQEFLGCRWHSKQGLPGPRAGRALWKTQEISSLLEGLLSLFWSLCPGGHHQHDMLGFWLLSPEYLCDLASGWGTTEPGHPAVLGLGIPAGVSNQVSQ
uniref:MHC class I-like antigen recognition-like domain-containing protein n=1 Tax=Spermophilus dauricus TaxID=99837 RepID=A0A8C9US34_SPEDA